jgi:Icc protein
MIIAQISDIHISLKKDENDAHLQRAVAHLLELPARPDVVIITGDCVDAGDHAEYSRFLELLKPLPMPYYVIPGNHDDRMKMLELFGAQGTQPLNGFVQYAVDDGPVRLIALDTQVPGKSEGYLSDESLQWLEERLAEAPTRPTLIFMHHPPIRMGLYALDQMRLINTDAFGAIIARHPQVERIVSGHIHMSVVRRFAGSMVMTCPSTAHMFLPDVNHPEVLNVLMEPPACLMHVWSEDTGLTTYTSLIADHGPVKQIHDGEKWTI